MFVNSPIPTHKTAVSCSPLDIAKSMQTSLPSTNQPVARDNAETIQEALGKILKRTDTLTAILCGTWRLIRQIQFSFQLLPKLLETHPLLELRHVYLLQQRRITQLI